MPDLINRPTMERAMQEKHRQLTEYRASLSNRDDEVGRHAYTIAEGRLLQLEADMALLSLQPTPCQKCGGSHGNGPGDGDCMGPPRPSRPPVHIPQG